MTMEEFETHEMIEIERAESVDEVESMAMPVDLYHTAERVVVDVGLPRCLPHNIHLTLGGGALLIQADRHKGEEGIDDERNYTMRELPHGRIGRRVALPESDLDYDAAVAHFKNGLLVVTIPIQAS